MNEISIIECIHSETVHRGSVDERVSNAVEKFSENGLFVLWGKNAYAVIQNGKIVWEWQCTTAKRWFWTEFGSYQTPIWMHEIWAIIWEWIHPFESIKLRKPTWKILDTWVSWMVGRLIEMHWIEFINRNTDFRDVFVHGTPNIQFWWLGDWKQSLWCIWLLPQEAIKVADVLWAQENGYIYITEAETI